MPNRLIILSNHTLFSEGVASRLRRYPERVEINFVDPQQSDYIEQISLNQPSAVIMDAADSDATQCCVLCDLLSAHENVTIIRLDVQRKDIRVITSMQQHFDEVRNILDIVDS